MQRSKRLVFAITAMLTLFVVSFAQAAPWWKNPVLKYKTAIPGTAQPHYMNKDKSDQWLISGTAGGLKENVYLFSLPELCAAQQGSEVTWLAVATAQEIGLGQSPGFRAGAISDDLGLYLSGASANNGYAALPVTSSWTNTTARGINAYYIGGKDLVYAGEGANTSGNVYVYDFETETETPLVTPLEPMEPTYITNVKVGGVEANRTGGLMHLYVQFNNGAIYIYRLNADGMSVGAMVQHFTPTQTIAFLGETATIKNMRSFEVADDETYAFIAHHQATHQLSVVWTHDPTTLLLLK